MTTTLETSVAKPVVKWVGGKRLLAERILDLAPKEFTSYHEPFMGGAAVFFALRARGYTGPAFLSDVNPNLVNAYWMVRSEPEALIRALRRHANTRAHYDRVRALNPASLSPVQQAARFIYLNKTCFNGVWRENAAGEMNTPFGHNPKAVICDAEGLRAASRALQDTTIRCEPFPLVRHNEMKGAFVYFDPPYWPASDTANFTTFSKGGFGLNSQIQLRDEARLLATRGATVVISNSDTRVVRELYEGWRIERVKMPRALNCKASGRGKVGEVLIIAGGAR